MLIEGRAISIAIDGRPVLRDESITCHPGEMTALVGPSGSGKTTLLHALGLLLPVSTGEIFVGSRDVTHYSSGKRRQFWRDHASFVLQDYGLIEEETVEFNVTMRSRSPRRKGEASNRLFAALEKTGLADRHGEIASHLSGGEKQRLALARAIYREASVLYVDEPTASLDAANRRKVIDLFGTFASGGATVIIATHDEDMISACQQQYDLGQSDQEQP